MNNERKILEKYNLSPIKISYRHKTKIVDTDNGKYTLKVKTTNNKSIHRYLDAHNFKNYLPQINNSSDPYEIYPYIKEKDIDRETKSTDLIYILSLLHNKTTSYEVINQEDIKEIYEETTNKINYLLSYYYDLQDYIENKVYMSPAEYLLIRNINLVYFSLNDARSYIDKWYKIKSEQKKERQVFLHNNISLDHFLEGDNQYLINWKKARQGNVVYDFVNFYRNEYQNLEMEKLYDLYQSKYQYTTDEKQLFYALIKMPWKITFKDTNYVNTVNVGKLIDYLEKANKLVLKDDKKDQKTQKEKFEKQDNYIKTGSDKK